MSEPIHILSLGAGVQSSTLALMAAAGLVTPMPVASVFADTKNEPTAVYEWLDWLEKQLPFPVIRVTAGDLKEQSLRNRVSKKSGQTYTRTLIPAYIAKYAGGKSLLGRKCTAEFKVRVILKAIRNLVKPPRSCKEVKVIQWIGISVDEAHRMKPSKLPWIEHRWPLVDMDLTREFCLNWCETHIGRVPPRSACEFCPFHSDAEWVRLRAEEPESFARSVQFEKDLQASLLKATGTARLNGIAYLHASLKPLDQVVFSDLPARAQVSQFGNECTGLCGV